MLETSRDKERQASGDYVYISISIYRYIYIYICGFRIFSWHRQEENLSRGILKEEQVNSVVDEKSNRMRRF